MKKQIQSQRRRPKQLSFLPAQAKEFGGALLHGRRRRRRPLSSKHSLHVVIRSSWARGPHSFRSAKNLQTITRLIEGIARKFHVKVYRYAIVGNHIHMMIGFYSHEQYKSYLRLLCGQIASHVMGRQSFENFRKALVKKWGDTSETQGKGQQFFQFRPYTRLINWGRDFRGCVRYLRRNFLEAIGFISYKPRVGRYPTKISDRGKNGAQPGPRYPIITWDEIDAVFRHGMP